MTGATRELLEQKVKPALTAFLHQRGLELSEQKTVITPIQEGFDFLGHTLRKYGDKLLITPAKSKVQSLRQKIQTADSIRLGPHPRGAPATTQPAVCAVGPTTTATEPPSGPLASWTITFTTNSGAGPPDATPTSPRPGRSANTSPRRAKRGVQRAGPSGHGREPRAHTLPDGQHQNRTPYQSPRGRKPL